MERVAEIAGQSVAPSRILAIGDGPATDILGANRQGIDALFIGGGIHGQAWGEGDAFPRVRRRRCWRPMASRRNTRCRSWGGSGRARARRVHEGEARNAPLSWTWREGALRFADAPYGLGTKNSTHIAIRTKFDSANRVSRTITLLNVRWTRLWAARRAT